MKNLLFAPLHLQAKGEPLYVGMVYPDLVTSPVVAALIYARPLGETYTAADVYPFYFGSKVSNPPSWDWSDWNTFCLESSPTAYDPDLGYALCVNGGASSIITFSTAEANRGEIVCSPMPSSAAHRGEGDISLGGDR